MRAWGPQGQLRAGCGHAPCLGEVGRDRATLRRGALPGFWAAEEGLGFLGPGSDSVEFAEGVY